MRAHGADADVDAPGSQRKRERRQRHQGECGENDPVRETLHWAMGYGQL
jgi:hypothetical protein